MAVGAGMVFPFFNVYLTTLGADSTTVGYVYALGGLSAAAVGLSAPLISRQLGSLVGVAVVRLSIVPFYLALILTPSSTAGRRDPHRAADEHLDGLADRFDLHCRSATPSGEDASLRFTGGRMEPGVLRGEPGGRSPHRQCRIPGDLFRSGRLHRASDDHLRRLLQPASARALRRAEQRPATLATQSATVGRCASRRRRHDEVRLLTAAVAARARGGLRSSADPVASCPRAGERRGCADRGDELHESARLGCSCSPFPERC